MIGSPRPCHRTSPASGGCSDSTRASVQREDLLEATERTLAETAAAAAKLATSVDLCPCREMAAPFVRRRRMADGFNNQSSYICQHQLRMPTSIECPENPDVGVRTIAGASRFVCTGGDP